MNKKLILIIALMGISAPIQGMGTAQASRFSWQAIKAGISGWKRTYQERSYHQQQQAHYRAKSANFRPLGAVMAGIGMGTYSPEVVRFQEAPVEFSIKNIDTRPDKKDSFAAFARENIAIPKDARVINYEVIKGIVHFINTYPDQVPHLAKIAQEKGQDVHQDIQRALAAHDATFKLNIKPSYLSPSALGWNVLGNTISSTIIQTPLAAIDVPRIDQKIIESGCAEFSPEYFAAWKIEGKRIRTQLGKDIARGTAIGMCQSIATDMINEKINDKKMSELLVKAATPLVANAYNKQFTLRNNTESILAVGIGETINAAGKKVAQYLPAPVYKKNSYNNLFYYGVNSAYWMGNTFVGQIAKDIAVGMTSNVLAQAACDKAFGPKPTTSIAAVSVNFGDQQ